MIKIGTLISKDNNGHGLVVNGENILSCPECKSDNVSADNISIINGKTDYENFKCLDCGYEK